MYLHVVKHNTVSFCCIVEWSCSHSIVKPKIQALHTVGTSRARHAICCSAHCVFRCGIAETSGQALPQPADTRNRNTLPMRSIADTSELPQPLFKDTAGWPDWVVSVAERKGEWEERMARFAALQFRLNQPLGCTIPALDQSCSLHSTDILLHREVLGYKLAFARSKVVRNGLFKPTGANSDRGECLRVAPETPLTHEEEGLVDRLVATCKEQSVGSLGLVFQQQPLNNLGAAGLVLVLADPVDFCVKAGTRVVARVVTSVAVADPRAHAESHAELFTLGKVTQRGDHGKEDLKSVAGFHLKSFGFRNPTGGTGPNATWGRFLTKEDPKRTNCLADRLAAREYLALGPHFPNELERVLDVVQDCSRTAAPPGAMLGSPFTLKTVTLNYASRLHVDNQDAEAAGSFLLWWDHTEEGTVLMPGLFWIMPSITFIPRSSTAMWFSSHELKHQSEACMCWRRDESDGKWGWAGDGHGRFGTALVVNSGTLGSWAQRNGHVYMKVDKELKARGRFALEEAPAAVEEMCSAWKKKAPPKKRVREGSVTTIKGVKKA